MASEAVHGASCVTGIDAQFTAARVRSQKTPPAWTELEGQGRPQGVDGLGGGELHHNRTHWRSLLILRKGRAPNGRTRTIQGLRCQLVGSALEGSWLPAQPGPLQPASPPMAAIRRNRIGLVIPSIGYAIISLCSLPDGQDQRACQRGTCGRATANSDGHRR